MKAHFDQTEKPLLLQPLLDDDPEDLKIRPTDSEAMQLVKEILAKRVKPFVAEDGGDVALISFEEGSGQVVI